MDRILRYLHDTQPDAVVPALAAAGCFEPYGQDPQRYAAATRMLPNSCQDEVIALLNDLRRMSRSMPASENDFDALQNAEVLAGAERYYRTMVRGDGARSRTSRDRGRPAYHPRGVFRGVRGRRLRR